MSKPITPKEITTLTQAYDARYKLISKTFFSNEAHGDNRSSWYSLEDLRKFLDDAEKQAGTLKYNMDGVRLYLGAHPTDGETPGYTTLLMVPTGIPMTSEEKMVDLPQKGGVSPDIPETNGLDHGHNGRPSSANYPQ